MTLSPDLYKMIRDDHSDRATFSAGDGWASVLKPYRRNQDALFVAEPSEGSIVAGVLDGLGSYSESGKVARGVAEWLKVSVEDGTLGPEQLAHDPEHYKDFFNELSEWAVGLDGSSTLALAAMHRATRQVGYLSIGDSRVYHTNRQKFTDRPGVQDLLSGRGLDATRLQHTTQLTRDEQLGGAITNSISTGNFHGVKQMGSVQLSPGDRIVIATDGVLRDKDDQGGAFSPAEIGRFASPELNPLDALTNLVLREANYSDDRAAVIVDA